MKLSLKGILALFVCLSVAAQLVGIWGLFLANHAVEVGTAYRYEEESTLRACSAMDAYLQRKADIAVELSYNEQVKEYALASHASRYRLYPLLSQLMKGLLLDDIAIGARLDFRDETSLNAGRIPEIRHVEEPFHQPVYEDAAVKKSRIGEPLYYLQWRTPLYSLAYEQTYGGALFVAYDLQALMDVYFDKDCYLVLDGEGQALLNPAQWPEEMLADIWQTEKRLRHEGQEYWITAARSSVLGWDILKLTNQSHLLSTNPWYRYWAVFLSSVMVLCGSLVAAALYRKLLAPVEDIIRQIKAIGREDQALVVHESRYREFAFLTQNINHMLIRLQNHAALELDMRQALYDANLKYVNEQLLHLQSQINPHFLYNNLECIRGMARAGAEKSICEMCTAMARIYRYGTRRETLMVSLTEEIGCLREYERIIRLRYGETYQFIYRAAPDCGGIILPRMTLQPLCENAILHGLVKKQPTEPRIWITARKENDSLILWIEDNGVGMDEGKLEAMNRELAEADGSDERPLYMDRIGVFNIHKRLRLVNGEGCRLRMENRAEGGLRVIVTVSPFTLCRKTEDNETFG